MAVDLSQYSYESPTFQPVGYDEVVEENALVEGYELEKNVKPSAIPSPTTGKYAAELAEAELLKETALGEEELAVLNSEFDSQADNDEYWSDVYTSYVDQHGVAVKEGNMEEAARLNAEYTSIMDRKDFFDASNACTWEGNCAEGAVNYYDNQGEAWTYD